MVESIKFPIFFQDDDKFMVIITSYDKLNYVFEVNDVCSQEFGWDSSGNPLEIFLDKDNILVKLTGRSTELEKLRSAIFTFANVDSYNLFDPPTHIEDPEELFELAVCHYENYYPTLLKRIKNWLRK